MSDFHAGLISSFMYFSISILFAFHFILLIKKAPLTFMLRGLSI